MRSTSGEHFIALDQVRALAVFLVIAWHFLHGRDGQPIPLQYVPSVFPFALLDEGHTGVSLFMVLSGYLFAKLLDGKSVDFAAFLRNRLLRLLPLLAIVVVLAGIEQVASGAQTLEGYSLAILEGVLLPTLPNGAWSITVEIHFYVLLPWLLWLMRASRLWLLAIVLGAIALRWILWRSSGEVHFLAYWTIVGRIDQFVLGMLAFELRGLVARRHLLALTIVATFMALWWQFDRLGGFYLNPSYPSTSPLWIVLTTLEGIGYATGIAWYDNSFSHSRGSASRFVARIGEYSYSIYLMHFFVVFQASQFVHERVMDISNFYLACAWALLFLLCLVPIGYLSFRYVESPFLRMRKPYVAAASPAAAQAS